MLSFYVKNGNFLKKQIYSKGFSLDAKPVWIDLFDMNREEELYVEELLGINIPSREEMHEIEVSRRLYHKNQAVYMTASLVAKADTTDPEVHAVTFIIIGNTLVTVRYCDTVPFQNFSLLAETLPAEEQDARSIYAGLVDHIIDRIADILEQVGHNIESMTREVFKANSVNSKKLNFKDIIKNIGREGNLISKACESLVTLSRMVTHAIQSPLAHIKGDVKANLLIRTNDINALNDHATFLSSKITFLLDATLGMINIEQNNIIKIFSVAAVISMPPTLIASIYGMNFHMMPELSWKFGYPFAISLMIASAILPYKFFKRRKWL